MEKLKENEFIPVGGKIKKDVIEREDCVELYDY